MRDRPGWSYAVITPDVTGAFVTVDGDDVWLFHVNLAAGETVDDFAPQRGALTAAPDCPAQQVARGWRPFGADTASGGGDP